MANYSKTKKKNFKKRSLNEVRSYWVGVGIALGHAGRGNVSPYFENARKRKSMEAGFSSEMSRDRPSVKVNLFK